MHILERMDASKVFRIDVVLIKVISFIDANILKYASPDNMNAFHLVYWAAVNSLKGLYADRFDFCMINKRKLMHS